MRLLRHIFYCCILHRCAAASCVVAHCTMHPRALPPHCRCEKCANDPNAGKAKEEVKKEEPKEVAVVAPPPAKVEKASGSLYFSEELDAFIRLTDRHIFATKVDDTTFACIPDLDECLGMLKAGVKPEEAVPTDMEAIVEDEEEASEEESESE